MPKTKHVGESGFSPGLPQGFDLEKAGKGLGQEQDDFTADRCDECKGIDGGHSINCTKHPDFVRNGHSGMSATHAKGKRRNSKPGASGQGKSDITETNGASQNGHIDLREIPLDKISPWQAGQMRTRFDQGKLEELAASIKEKGVLQPILVRRIMPVFKVRQMADGMYAVISPGGAVISKQATEKEALDAFEARNAVKTEFELIAGERRWRASKIAGLAMIPAIVRELDDRTALEIQVIENLQRTDLSALEEAAGYKRLIAEHGYTADKLAEKLGKSKSYVYGRLKLNNLPEACAKALSAGAILPSIAELVGRIPNEALREKLSADILRGAGEEYFYPPSYRRTKDLIERGYMKELKAVPFDQNDKKLLPSAGSCKACPKRTGNNRIEYPDGRADICTDPECFRAKVEAQQKLEIQKLASGGARLLDDEENKELFGNYSLTITGEAKYVDLDEQCYEEIPDEEEDSVFKSARTYGEILGEVIKVEAIATDSNGKPHRLVSREVAAAALKEKGIEIEPLHRDYDPEIYKKKREAEAKKRKIREAVIIEASEAVGKAIAAKCSLQAFMPADADKLFQVLIGRYCVRFGQRDPDRIVALAKRRGKTIQRGHNMSKQAPTLIEGLQVGEMIGLFAEMLAIADLDGWARGYDSKAEDSICVLAGVDLKEIEKRHAKEQRDKAKPKAKGAAK